jgi:hypothetical protein
MFADAFGEEGGVDISSNRFKDSTGLLRPDASPGDQPISVFSGFPVDRKYFAQFF